MSGIRSGTRLDQLQDLRRQVTIQLEHARRNGMPAAHLLALADAVDNEIRAEGGTPPPPPGYVVVRRRRKATPPAPHRSDVLLRELGVTANEVKQWAVGAGLLDAVKRGRIAGHIVESYALAHVPLDQNIRKAGTTS